MLVVTDIDNTLYDWVRLWAGAFDTMMQSLARSSGHGVDMWMKAAQAVHVRRGATECPSLLCDLADSSGWPVGVDAARVLPGAAAAYRNHWDHHLTTYPGVRAALTQLSHDGHEVVAYTEGDASIAATRLSRLGLAGVIRRVFGRPPLPSARETAWCTVGTLRHCPIAIDFIPREDSKPNPMGLRTIVSLCGATPATTLYVGDNLWKDVVMAQRLGASAAWAKYGTLREPTHVSLLERVAHWTANDVVAERQAAERVMPDTVLDDPRDLPKAIATRATAVAMT